MDADGDGDADADLEIAEPEAPASPAPPVLTPCPEGWREVPADGPEGVATCDPWPAGGAEECAGDEAHFPGEPGCSRIGTACPPGDWAEDLPSDGEVLFVRAGAPAGGDGTRASPFGSIAAALAEAGSGAVIALSKGTFDEAVRLDGGRTLWGACVAETIVACSDASADLATVRLPASQGALRNLQIGGARVGLQVEFVGASVEIEDVLVSSARVYGVQVAHEATLSARSLVVRGTEPRPSDGTEGQGLRVSGAAEATVTRAVLERNRDLGVVAFGAGTRVTLDDVVVQDTLSRESDEEHGRGLRVEDGATVEVNRAVFERNRQIGVMAFDAGTTLTLNDVIVRDTLSQESDGTSGFGLIVQDGAVVEVHRAVLERNRLAGVFVYGAGTSVILSDVVVRDTLSQESDSAFGRGLDVEGGASVEVTRAVLERNYSAGVLVAEVGSTLALADAVVRETLCRQTDGTGGRGLSVQEGAAAEVNRAVLERNREIGVYVTDAGTTLTLTDVVVQDTQGRVSDDEGGRGIAVQDGAVVEVSRALLERNREYGVFAAGEGVVLTLTDTVIRDTLSQESDGMAGRGLGAQEGASVEVSRAELVRNRDLGVSAFDPGTTLRLTDVVVRETLERECVVDTCAGAGSGAGIAVFCGAAVEATRFLVTESAQCGAQLAYSIVWDSGAATYVDCDVGGSLDLHDGEVSHNPIGINVQIEGFDLDRLMDNVVLLDNLRDLDSVELPVPEPGTALGF